MKINATINTNSTVKGDGRIVYEFDIPDSEIRRMVESVTKAPEVCPNCDGTGFVVACFNDGDKFIGKKECPDCKPPVDDSLAKAPDGKQRPTIVCLCGSTRFYDEFQRAIYDETMAGKIVLSVGFYPHSSKKAHGQEVGCTHEQKIALDELHKRKIDIADEIYVLNVDRYIGESTRSEIDYAEKHGKIVRYLEQIDKPPVDDSLAKAQRMIKNCKLSGEREFVVFDIEGLTDLFMQAIRERDVAMSQSMTVEEFDDWTHHLWPPYTASNICSDLRRKIKERNEKRDSGREVGGTD